jgi:anti-sigma factor RsiW
MWSCRQVTARATDYLEHDLSRWERLQFRLHLMMCRACDRYLAQLRLTREATHALRTTEPAPAPPPELREAFRQWRSERKP